MKKLAPNVGSLKGNLIRKWCPNFHSHPPRMQFFFVQGRRPPSRRMGMIIGPRLSDLITFQAANIRGKLFLSRRFFILVLATCFSLNINIIPNNRFSVPCTFVVLQSVAIKKIRWLQSDDYNFSKFRARLPLQLDFFFGGVETVECCLNIF